MSVPLAVPGKLHSRALSSPGKLHGRLLNSSTLLLQPLRF